MNTSSKASEVPRFHPVRTFLRTSPIQRALSATKEFFIDHAAFLTAAFGFLWVYSEPDSPPPSFPVVLVLISSTFVTIEALAKRRQRHVLERLERLENQVSSGGAESPGEN